MVQMTVNTYWEENYEKREEQGYRIVEESRTFIDISRAIEQKNTAGSQAFDLLKKPEIQRR